MARRPRRISRPESSINITPLGDVSLSLLLGFLVITPIITQTLSTTLPQEGAGVAAGQVRQDPIIVLTPERKILLNGKEIAEDELPARLEALLPSREGSERKVMFTGAGEVSYQEVIRLLDLLKSSGVDAIGIR